MDFQKFTIVLRGMVYLISVYLGKVYFQVTNKFLVCNRIVPSDFRRIPLGLMKDTTKKTVESMNIYIWKYEVGVSSIRNIYP